MTKPRFEDISLEQCLKFLSEGNMDNNVPTKCYQLLKFPEEKSNYNVIPKPKHLEYFSKLFANVTITKAIKVKPDGTFQVPNTLEKELKKRNGYTITPIILTPDNLYGLFQDAKNDIWYIFVPPGGKIINNSVKLERKIVKLLEERYKLNIALFYHNIEYKPEPGTVAYQWWPSWIIYGAIKKPGFEREAMVDKLLLKILRNDDDYRKFVDGFKDFMRE